MRPFLKMTLKNLNLFVIGVGNVGSKLLEQIQKQQEYLRREFTASDSSNCNFKLKNNGSRE